MANYYVFSTLTCDNEYTSWRKIGDKNVAQDSVIIRGGSGVMNKNFITPMGIMTEINETQYALLQENSEFKAHCERGFITVEKKKYEPEQVVSNMASGDSSRPLTPSDVEFMKENKTNKRKSTK